MDTNHVFQILQSLQKSRDFFLNLLAFRLCPGGVEMVVGGNGLEVVAASGLELFAHPSETFKLTHHLHKLNKGLSRGTPQGFSRDPPPLS